MMERDSVIAALAGCGVSLSIPLRERPRPSCYAWSVRRFGVAGAYTLDQRGEPLFYSLGLVLERGGRGAFGGVAFLSGKRTPAPHGTITAIFLTLNRPETTTP